MKKILLTLAVLVILLGMINCENEQEEEEVNPFIGTWEEPYSGELWVFTKDVLTVHTKKGISMSGTYTYDNNTIYIYVDPEKFPHMGAANETINYTWSINDNTLYLDTVPLIKKV